MKAAAVRLAALATGGAAFLVLLLYVPTLQAPFLVPKFAALEIGATVALLAFGLARMSAGRPVWSRPIVAGVLLVAVTSAVSWAAATTTAIGAPYALSAMARWGALFGLAAGASVLDDAPGERQRVLEAVTVASAVVSAIGLLQHVELLPFAIPVISTPGSTFGNRNLAAEVIALALPLGIGAAAGAPRREARGAMIGALALELVYLAVTRARGAWLGAACGVVASLWLSRLRFSRAALGVVVGTVAVAGAAAILPGRFNAHDAGDSKRYAGVFELLEEGFDARSTALKTRLGLWRRTLAMIADHPLAGVGPGNWPRVFPRYAEPNATRDGVLSTSLAPRQAHDDFLEHAAETGVLGLLALGVLGVGIAVAVRERLKDPDGGASIAGAAAGSWIALGVLCVASFPFEMPGTLALAGVSLGLVAGDRRRTTRGAAGARRNAYASALAALALLPCVALRAERSVRASRWLGVAERALRRDHGPAGASAALDALPRSLAASPGEFRAELETAQMLLRLNQWDGAADAAVAAVVAEPYSPNAWATRASAHLGASDPATARREATAALHVLQDCPLALQVRSRAAAQEHDMQASEADRRRLLDLAQSALGSAQTAREARALWDEGP